MRFVTRVCRQVVEVPVGTNCAPKVAGLFAFCYERSFMYLFLMINRLILLRPDIWIFIYFDKMVSQIYPSGLHLKLIPRTTKSRFLDLHLSIPNGVVSAGVCSKRVCISQLIQFARASSYVADFNTRRKLLTFLEQGYQCHKLHKTFF